MNGTRAIRVKLTRPINVLILYATALATEAGPMWFFDDIYGYDENFEGRRVLRRCADSSQSALPVADAPVVEMHEIGSPIKPHAPPAHAEREFAEPRGRYPR